MPASSLKPEGQKGRENRFGNQLFATASRARTVEIRTESMDSSQQDFEIVRQSLRQRERRRDRLRQAEDARNRRYQYGIVRDRCSAHSDQSRCLEQVQNVHEIEPENAGERPASLLQFCPRHRPWMLPDQVQHLRWRVRKVGVRKRTLHVSQEFAMELPEPAEDLRHATARDLLGIP